MMLNTGFLASIKNIFSVELLRTNLILMKFTTDLFVWLLLPNASI